MGQLATNPQTGETIYYDGQAWAPAKMAENPQTGERVAWDGDAWRPVKSKAAVVGDMVASAVRGPGQDQPIPDAAPATPGEDAIAKVKEALSPGRFGEAVFQGATLGFGDEIRAGLEGTAAGLHGEDANQTYDKTLHNARYSLDSYRKDNPLASVAGEILGGVLVPGIGFNQAMRASTALGKYGGLALAGAGTGAVTGFGSERGGLENRLGGATQGAVMGGILAPAIVAGANLVGKGVNTLLDSTGLSSSARTETLADRKILQALERSGYSPDDAMKALDDIRASGADVPALADLGESTRRLTSAAARVPGKGADVAADFVETRQAGQGARATSFFEDLLGTDKSATSFLDDLNKTQKMAATPLYEKALASDATVDTGPLLRKIEGELRDAVGPQEAALKRVAGFLVRSNADGDLVPKTDIASLHKVKIGIDGLIENAGTDTAIGRAGKRTLLDLKNDLLAMMDKAEPTYAEARSVWAGAMDLEDAVNAGREAFKVSPEAIASTYKALPPSAQPAFRIGLLDAIKETVGRQGDGINKVRTLFGNPRIREQFAAVLSPDEYASLAKYMGAEKTMFKAGAEILGNSKTAQRAADDADFLKDPVSLLNLTRPRNWVEVLARKLTGYAKGMNEKTAERIVSTMTETDQSKLAEILKALESVRVRDITRMSNPLRSGVTYGVGIGGAGIPGLLGN